MLIIFIFAFIIYLFYNILMHIIKIAFNLFDLLLNISPFFFVYLPSG